MRKDMSYEMDRNVSHTNIQFINSFFKGSVHYVRLFVALQNKCFLHKPVIR